MNDTRTAWNEIRALARQLHVRTVPPFPACEQICSHEPTCLYRHAVGDFIANGRLSRQWDEAMNKGDKEEILHVASIAAFMVVDYPRVDDPVGVGDDVVTRVSLCFCQQMLVRDPLMDFRSRRTVVDELVKLKLGQEVSS
jgi:hypothetical protein